MFGITIYGDTLDLGRVRVHDCARCGPSNHRLRMRYRSLVLLYITGLPLRRRWLLRCEGCRDEQPTSDALASRYVQGDPIPWLHRNLRVPMKLLLALSVVLVLGLAVLIALTPSLEERVLGLQPGHSLLLELGHEEGSQASRFAWLRVSEVQGEQIVIAPASESFASENEAQRSRWRKNVPSQPEDAGAPLIISREQLLKGIEERWVLAFDD